MDLRKGRQKGKPRRGCVCVKGWRVQRSAPGRVRARREGRARPAPRAAGPQLTVRFSLSVSAVGDVAAASDVPQDGLLLHGPFARKPKRIRTAFSPSQLLRLERAFEKNHYVVGAERTQLAGSLSLSETQVMNGPRCARGPGGGGPGGRRRGTLASPPGLPRLLPPPLRRPRRDCLPSNCVQPRGGHRTFVKY